MKTGSISVLKIIESLASNIKIKEIVMAVHGLHSLSAL